LDKPKQRYIRLLENALFGFGLSKLGLFDGFSIQIVTSKVEMMTCLSGKFPYLWDNALYCQVNCLPTGGPINLSGIIINHRGGLLSFTEVTIFQRKKIVLSPIILPSTVEE
jgi:hypothetical protein